MRLKSLRLHGFKSFADRTSLDFREGLTAVVGSNGCGKSNIADAIRWVLGEQRASAIRGSKMEEVIFQGTTRRRPLNFAEVSLVFDNSEGRIPIPQTEVEVSRKVFREGGSEYALNRTACRLRDVQGLLRDTGLGSNAYSIIEASMIETLLSERAEERRILFEEAAGIGKYKDSRRAALRRMEAAEGDLTRLGDLIAEVESKVRSLARQKGRAERHERLRARRLELEVAVASTELSATEAALRADEQRHARLDQEETALRAQRSSAESRVEERRIEAAKLARQRASAAEQLEGLRRKLEAREREILVADERRAHAEMRIEQIVRERAETKERRTSLEVEMERGAEERARATAVLESLRTRLEEQGEENAAVRGIVAAERATTQAAAARAREVAHQIATAEGARAAAERRLQEVEARRARLERRGEELRSEAAGIEEQTDLWAEQADRLRGRLEAAAEAEAAAREDVRVLREREQEAGAALRSAEDALSQRVAQLSAREALERGYEGFAPAVAAVLDARERFPGVRGPLADFVPTEGKSAAWSHATEAFLGPLLQALVVDDLRTARLLRDWFREEWEGGGSLLLLPLDAPGGPSTGAGWVGTLLGNVEVVASGDPLEDFGVEVTRVGPQGDVIEARGVIRLTEQGSGEGILARREALARLRDECEAASAERERTLRERDGLRAALEASEERAREAGEIRASAATELQRMEVDSAAHDRQRTRLERDRAEIDETTRSLQREAEETVREIQQVGRRLQDLATEVDTADAEAQRARARLDELEGRWEDAREAESELRVALARAEADVRELDRRHAAAEQAHAAALERLATIDAEAAELRRTLEGLSGVRERAGGDVEALFRQRDQEAAGLAAIEERITAVEGELERAETQSRSARRREGELGEARHRLELRIAELRSRRERVRERLEVEWGRPWDVLVREAGSVEGDDLDSMRAELREIAGQLDSLGPVNMLAVEEHAEEERRLDFLREQQGDLVKARDDLAAAIRQINRTARDAFMETFGVVRDNFRRTFQSLFQGGECDLWLADPDDPLESPVEIQASPKGKKTQRIHLLSGGERTLTALALVFALYLVKPSPFCVLDEVDAPLDESNVGRFIQLLHDFKTETQFIVITHNPRTMEAADWIYGVTMEEAGVSTIVGVELNGAWALEDQVA